MKQYVLDANVLMAAMISGKPIYITLFEQYQFFVPDFTIHELEKYKLLISSKTKLNPALFQKFADKLFQKLIVVPTSQIADTPLKQAIELCKDIDPKDTMYVALAIDMNLILVTRDIPLYQGLLKKGFANVILVDYFFKTR